MEIGVRGSNTSGCEVASVGKPLRLHTVPDGCPRVADADQAELGVRRAVTGVAYVLRLAEAEVDAALDAGRPVLVASGNRCKSTGAVPIHGEVTRRV
jgi:hypothetical protein